MALKELYWPGDGAGEPPPVSTLYLRSLATGAGLGLLFYLNTGSPVSFAFLPFSFRLTKQQRQRLNAIIKGIPERLWLSFLLFWLIWSPDYTKARAAVRAVAIRPDLNGRHMWGKIGTLAQQANDGENLYRHQLACVEFGAVPHRKKHVRNLALELAYYALKTPPRF